MTKKTYSFTIRCDITLIENKVRFPEELSSEIKKTIIGLINSAEDYNDCFTDEIVEIIYPFDYDFGDLRFSIVEGL